MKNKIVIIGYIILPAFSQNPSQDKNWQVIFEDDFSVFNSTIWKKVPNGTHGDYDYRDVGKRHEEPQVYIQDNAYIENGKFVLYAKNQNYPCPRGNSFLYCQYGGTHKYTSGQFESKATYKYGYYEIYAKLPAGTGLFPAFWLWSSGNGFYNEIDIMEATGCNPYETSTNYRENPYEDKREAIYYPCNYTNGFHWYGAEWDKNKITWYIDRKAVRQVVHTGMQHPMFIIINLALFPDTWPNNCKVNSAILPAYMYVDQCNHYKLKYDCNTVVNEILNYNTFNYAVKKSISLSGVSKLYSGQNVSLRAKDFIELKDGFEVPIGAELYLDINPCE